MMFAAFFGWLLPRTAARRTWSGSLFLAWVYHLATGMMAFVVLAIVIPWIDIGRPWFFFDQAAREFRRHFWEALGIAALGVAGTEAGFVVLAALVMPWGCQDEPLGRSFAGALRQTWLHTTHVLPVILMLCALMIWWDRTDSAWARSASLYGYSDAYITILLEQHELPPPPQRPDTLNHGSPEWMAYSDALGRWRNDAAFIYYRKQSLSLRHGYTFIALSICFLFAWVIWSLIRAVATPRPMPVGDRRDPMCEYCGYNLLMTPADSRCPECGVAVVESLGPDVRSGSPLMLSGRAWWRRYLITVATAVNHPCQLGRMLPTKRILSGYHVVFGLHMMAWFAVIAASSTLYSHWEILHRIGNTSVYPKHFAMRYIEGIAIGGLLVLGLMGAVALWVLLVTLWARWGTKRNLGHVAMAMASYASGLLLAWTVVLCVAFVALTGLYSDDQIMQFVEQDYLEGDLVMLVLWGLPTLAVVVKYGVAVTRGTMAARWGNR